MEKLVRLGTMSIPVIFLGDEFSFAQEICELADCIGVKLDRKQMYYATLNEKINPFLAVSLHCRHFNSVVTKFGIQPDRFLRDIEFAELLLLEQICDDEVPLTAAANR